jgi:hypothetical protein
VRGSPRGRFRHAERAVIASRRKLGKAAELIDEVTFADYTQIERDCFAFGSQ